MIIIGWGHSNGQKLMLMGRSHRVAFASPIHRPFSTPTRRHMARLSGVYSLNHFRKNLVSEAMRLPLPASEELARIARSELEDCKRKQEVRQVSGQGWLVGLAWPGLAECPGADRVWRADGRGCGEGEAEIGKGDNRKNGYN